MAHALPAPTGKSRLHTLYDLVAAIFQLIESRSAEDDSAAVRHVLTIGKAACLLIQFTGRSITRIRARAILHLELQRVALALDPGFSSQERDESLRALELLICHARAFRRERHALRLRRDRLKLRIRSRRMRPATASRRAYRGLK